MLFLYFKNIFHLKRWFHFVIFYFVGIRFALPARFSNVEWMGLGPHEIYDDRYYGLSVYKILSLLDIKVNCIISYLILFYHIVSYSILSYLTLTYLIISYLIVSFLTLSYLTLSTIKFAITTMSIIKWFSNTQYLLIDIYRKFSGYLGVFEDTVEGLHTGYIVPQDCGRRADPRYNMTWHNWTVYFYKLMTHSSSLEFASIFTFSLIHYNLCQL